MCHHGCVMVCDHLVESKPLTVHILSDPSSFGSRKSITRLGSRKQMKTLGSRKLIKVV